MAIDFTWRDWAEDKGSVETHSYTWPKKGILVYIMETTWFAAGIIPEI